MYVDLDENDVMGCATCICGLGVEELEPKLAACTWYITSRRLPAVNLALSLLHCVLLLWRMRALYMVPLAWQLPQVIARKSFDGVVDAASQTSAPCQHYHD